VIGLALRGLRLRAGAFVATLLALFLGAVLVMACGGLMETGIRDNVPPQRLAGAALVVTGDRSYPVSQDGSGSADATVVLSERVPLDASLTQALGRVPGVASAVGEPDFTAALLGAGNSGTQAQGLGWPSASLTPYGLVQGVAPRTAGEVVMDAGLARPAGVAVGDRVEIAAHGGAASYRVTGLVRAPAGRDIARPALFFTAAQARLLYGDPASVADIAVTAAPGTDVGALRSRVTAALAGRPVSVLSGDDRGDAEHPEVLQDSSDLIALSAVFGGMAILVAVFVVAGTVGLSVQQRHREFALMRAVGGTPGQLRRMLVAETLLVAVVAAGLARLAGPAAGHWLYARLVGAGMVSSAVEFGLGWIPLMVAGGTLLLTALFGCLIGARRAVRVRPAEALAEAALQQRWFSWIRLVLAVVFLAGAAALALVTLWVMHGPNAASTAGPTVIACAIGLALIAPALTRLVTGLLTGPLWLVTGAAGRLALLNSRVRAVRTAAVVTPVMLATAVATGTLYLQTTQTAQADEMFGRSLRADAVLASASGGLDPSLLTAVRGIKGVAAAGAYATSTGFIERPFDSGPDEADLPLQGISADSAASTTAVRTTAGSLGALRGATVALPDSLAHTLHRGIGDSITLRLGDRSAVNVRVVALFAGRAGYDFALTPVSLLAPHTTAGLPTGILVRATPGTGTARLVTSLRTWAAAHPGVTVTDRGSVVAAHARGTATQAWVNYLIVGMLIAYTALSVVNTLVLATGERRREFGLQRLNGATRSQVLRMTALEALLVAAVGVLLGTAAAATTLVPFTLATANRLTPTGPWSIYLTVVATVTLLTLIATLVPTCVALRARPAVAAAG
jgi:putative ABC transport system permease protein